MKKIFALIVIAAVIAAIINIPDTADRITAIVVFSTISTVMILALGWPTLMLFYHRINQKWKACSERTNATPEEKAGTSVNSFDEPLGIGA